MGIVYKSNNSVSGSRRKHSRPNTSKRKTSKRKTSKRKTSKRNGHKKLRYTRKGGFSSPKNLYKYVLNSQYIKAKTAAKKADSKAAAEKEAKIQQKMKEAISKSKNELRKTSDMFKDL
jgi:hypothetical protein